MGYIFSNHEKVGNFEIICDIREFLNALVWDEKLSKKNMQGSLSDC